MVPPTKIQNAWNGTVIPEAHRACDVPARLLWLARRTVSTLCLRVYILCVAITSHSACAELDKGCGGSALTVLAQRQCPSQSHSEEN